MFPGSLEDKREIKKRSNNTCPLSPFNVVNCRFIHDIAWQATLHYVELHGEQFSLVIMMVVLSTTIIVTGCDILEHIQ